MPSGPLCHKNVRSRKKVMQEKRETFHLEGSSSRKEKGDILITETKD